MRRKLRPKPDILPQSSQPKRSSADVAVGCVASIGVRSSGTRNLCVGEEYVYGAGGRAFCYTYMYSLNV